MEKDETIPMDCCDKEIITKEEDVRFILKSKPFLIECKINVKQSCVLLSYSEQSNDLKFIQFAFLDLSQCNSNSNWSLCLFDHSKFAKFHFIINASVNNSKNFVSKLNSNLYKTLFPIQNTNNHNQGDKSTEMVILISINDSLYYQNINEQSEYTKNIKDKLILNTSSLIVFMSTFKASNSFNYKTPFDAISSKKLTTTQSGDNCLFILTKSGRIHLFAYTFDYVYKLCILSHYINKCYQLKMKSFNFLIYSTINNEIFAFNMDSCLIEAPIKSILLNKISIDQTIKEFFKGIFIF
jgi:hypothetical protein